MRSSHRFYLQLKRWMIFNSVGFIGILVQICTLALLVRICGFHYLVATVFAVEAAILNNFVWHEHWTWADRRDASAHNVFTRLLYFHLTNGLISIFGNVLLMSLFVEHFSFGYLPANGLAIALCSIFNFIAGDRLVFRAAGIEPRKKDWNMSIPKSNKASQAFILLTIVFIFHPSIIKSAELDAETVQAWNHYVQKTERRIQSEIISDNRFFIMDYQQNDKVLLEYKKITSGDIVIRKMLSESGSQTITVPGGTIHHWRGDILIPGANLESVLSRIEHPGLSDMAQEDVLESRILERSQDGFTLFLKLKRSKIVTVIYNTEHRIRFRRHGAGKASSSSVATRIAEVDLLDNNKELEKPEGRDHGFLWRMNSYWRYKQVPEGVIIECESLTLSREIPKFLNYMIRPIIDRIARESLERTLLSMRSRMAGDTHENRIVENIQTDTGFKNTGRP